MRIGFCHLDSNDDAGHVGEECGQPDHTLVIVIVIVLMVVMKMMVMVAIMVLVATIMVDGGGYDAEHRNSNQDLHHHDQHKAHAGRKLEGFQGSHSFQ